MKSGPARFEERSCNRKLSPVDMVPYPGGMRQERPTARAPFVSSTYTSIQATCDNACPFKRTAQGETRGCFADDGFTRMHMRRMDEAGRYVAPTSVIEFEAHLIDSAFRGRQVPQDGARGGRDLRLHVGGDVANEDGARLLAGAAKRWRARGGGAVWTYTHSWRSIPRRAWSKAITVFASVENGRQVRAARKLGYAPALVVAKFPRGDKAFYLSDGTRIVPCPAETRGTTCAECRLCLDRDLYALGAGIAFKAHGKAHLVALESLRRAQRAA